MTTKEEKELFDAIGVETRKLYNKAGLPYLGYPTITAERRDKLEELALDVRECNGVITTISFNKTFKTVNGITTHFGYHYCLKMPKGYEFTASAPTRPRAFYALLYKLFQNGVVKGMRIKEIIENEK